MKHYLVIRESDFEGVEYEVVPDYQFIELDPLEDYVRAIEIEERVAQAFRDLLVRW